VVNKVTALLVVKQSQFLLKDFILGVGVGTPTVTMKMNLYN
jgi:hypothetical protein